MGFRWYHQRGLDWIYKWDPLEGIKSFRLPAFIKGGYSFFVLRNATLSNLDILNDVFNGNLDCVHTFVNKRFFPVFIQLLARFKCCLKCGVALYCWRTHPRGWWKRKSSGTQPIGVKDHKPAEHRPSLCWLMVSYTLTIAFVDKAFSTQPVSMHYETLAINIMTLSLISIAVFIFSPPRIIRDNRTNVSR